MASVGGVSCDLVQGRAAALKQSVEIWEIPGQNGFGAMTQGQKESEYQFTLVKFESLANVNTWVGQIEALQATAVTIIDDFADTYSNMLVARVSQPRKMGVIYGGAAKVRGELEIIGVKLS